MDARRLSRPAPVLGKGGVSRQLCDWLPLPVAIVRAVIGESGRISFIQQHPLSFSDACRVAAGVMSGVSLAAGLTGAVFFPMIAAVT